DGSGCHQIFSLPLKYAVFSRLPSSISAKGMTIHPPHTDVTLRSARLTDLDALVALEQRRFNGDRLSQRSFRRRLCMTDSGLIVIAVGEQLAGYARITLNRRTRLARLYSIAIDPVWRGHGLGEK